MNLFTCARNPVLFPVAKTIANSLSDNYIAAENHKRQQSPLQSNEHGFISGTDVMIFKIFSPKNLAKILAFLTQNKASFCKNWIITLVFEKNANFFAENW
jgi:hypothetical protein